MLVRTIVIIVTLFSSMAYAKAAPSVVGTWKLIAMERQPAQEKAQPYCLAPTGLLTYTSQGYMSVSINCMKADKDDKLIPDPSRTIFYAGTYHAHKHTMSHHIMNANTLEFFGKNIDRNFEFKTENKIVFSGKTPNGDISRLTWERITS